MWGLREHGPFRPLTSPTLGALTPSPYFHRTHPCAHSHQSESPLSKTFSSHLSHFHTHNTCSATSLRSSHDVPNSEPLSYPHFISQSNESLLRFILHFLSSLKLCSKPCPNGSHLPPEVSQYLWKGLPISKTSQVA